MMKLIILSTLLLPAASAAQNPTPEAGDAPRAAPFGVEQTTPVLGQPRAGCMPIVQQVAGPDKRPHGTRLDQQPPARLLYAVDRQVNGCHEVTFVNERRVEGEGRR